MPRHPSRATRLVAMAAAAQLLAGLVSAVALQPEPAPAAAAVRARPPVPEVSRADAVRELLDTRARAVATRDRTAWLGTVDPRAPVFAAVQGRLFDALRGVPVAGWTYELDATREQPPNPAVDSRRGTGWWAPAVTLRYRLAGYDATPTAEAQHLTFVPRNGRWYLAADDDFADRTTRGLWDSGPVVAVRGRSTLVLGHPVSRPVLRTIADAVDASVPRVTAVWGPRWVRRVVVLVPADGAELQRLLGGPGDYSRIAALATAELASGAGGSAPVGDRVVVNPVNFAKLGSLGRRVVLTHEVTHVATRAQTGPGTPTWLVEGFADYVGYLGVTVPYRVSAQELRTAVRRGRVPTRLPADLDFDGGNADLAQVYEQAWLAANLLAERHGRAGLVRFYRAVAGGQPVDATLRELFGTDLRRFTADWRRDLTVRLR